MKGKRLRQDVTDPINRPKLLADASVTIYMDGLIMLLHDDDLTQAVIHAHAHGHSLKIVLLDDEGDVRWPPTPDLESLQERVGHPAGKFWLFISPTEHPTEPPHRNNYSARLHTDGERSFNRVLDFESQLYDHKLDHFRRDLVALLNMPQGDFYSAINVETEVCSLGNDQKPRHGKFEKTVTSSALPAADISRSVAGPDKHIVLLWQDDATGQVEEVFSEPLNGKTPYEVHVFNTPDEPSPHEGPEGHFLMYYDLFTLRETERRLFPTLKPGQVHEKRRPGREVTPDSPPCDNTRASRTDPFS